MEAKELRICNFIKAPFLGDVELEVTGIALAERPSLGYLHFIQTKSKSGSIFFELPEKYKPIPLTEEWLLRLGFGKCSDIFEDWPEYEKGFDIGKSITLSHDFECYQGIYSQKINYVHQLQNLYFALTGQELELK